MRNPTLTTMLISFITAFLNNSAYDLEDNYLKHQTPRILALNKNPWPENQRYPYGLT